MAAYYVTTTGSDGNNGSIGSPWLTPYHAFDAVPAGVNTIYFGAGTFTISTKCSVKTGVNAVGQGDTTIFKSAIANGPVLELSSASEGTDGNQTISYIKFDGDSLAGQKAIDIMARKNVKIHHCTFINFYKQGVSFGGMTGDNDGDPGTPATGNEFHDCTMTNCATYIVGDQGYGCLRIGGQTGMLVYNSTILQPYRGTPNTTGYCIKLTNTGYNNGLKIYNCTIKRDPLGPDTWDFAIELFHSLGGIEIYGNRIQGTIDFSANSSPGTVSLTDTKGYGFALKIYDNIIGQDTLQETEERGIDLERCFNSKIYIYRNKFQNLQYGITSSAYDNDVMDDVWIYNNTFTGIGLAGANANWFATAMMLGHSSTGMSYNNWNIWNNTIYADSVADNKVGIRLQMKGTAHDISIRNNIIRGFSAEAVLFYQSVITVLSVENNAFYDNGTDDAVNSSSTLNSYTKQNNRTDDPVWVSTSDFHLQVSSPCDPNGIAVGLTSDFDQVAYAVAPIGAYKYDAGTVIVAPTVITSMPMNITVAAAIGGGNVTSSGGANVTERGVCWGALPDPTTADTYVSTTGGIGLFSCLISGLAKSTPYHVRAYAINSVGISYGNDVSFSTRQGRILII